MIDLSTQQRKVIDADDNVFVTACPGSGKTRVLTEKVVTALAELESTKHRVMAVTFTNRAADEIADRLRKSAEPHRQAWTGTVHALALEWILRPYSGYVDELRKGFSVADEFYSRRLLNSLRGDFGINWRTRVRTAYSRQGELLTGSEAERELVEAYQAKLLEQRLIDFDMVLHFSYQLLQQRPEIARTLAAIFRLVCIDEYQDTNDLQYGILSSIVRAADKRIRLFVVGDRDQAIYSSLGGIPKTILDIKTEFGLSTLKHFELSGNYRSTQRIVDFCGLFQDAPHQVKSKASFAGEEGLITFNNRDIHKDDLAQQISSLVSWHLDLGVPSHEICIVAPRWDLVTDLGRQLVVMLPNAELDAPGLSPLRQQRDSTWFKLARLFLTSPHPTRYHARLRWASDFVHSLEQEIGREIDEVVRIPRNILRIRNAIESEEQDGLAYLRDVFGEFINAIELDTNQFPALANSEQSFFDGAMERLNDPNYKLDGSVESLRKLFRHPAGIVLNTCHGIKGEEYDVMICSGALRGFIPHWDAIMDRRKDESEDAKRLLYVVSSRAKRFLHLFSEYGHTTRKGDALLTTPDLESVDHTFDDLPNDVA